MMNKCYPRPVYSKKRPKIPRPNRSCFKIIDRNSKVWIPWRRTWKWTSLPMSEVLLQLMALQRQMLSPRVAALGHPWLAAIRPNFRRYPPVQISQLKPASETRNKPNPNYKCNNLIGYLPCWAECAVRMQRLVAVGRLKSQGYLTRSCSGRKAPVPMLIIMVMVLNQTPNRQQWHRLK